MEALVANNDRYELHCINNTVVFISRDDYKAPLKIDTEKSITIYKGFDSSNCAYAIKRTLANTSNYIPLMLEIRERARQLKIEPHNIMYVIDSAKDEKYTYEVMPLCDTNLTQLISQNKILNEQQAIDYFRQICYGLKILHDCNLTHRDIRTDSIMVIKSEQDSLQPYKLLVASYKPENNLNENKNIEMAYTRAPEVVNKVYDRKADIYSLGCVLYKMITKNEPFIGENTDKIIISKTNKTLDVGKELSLTTMAILEGCLQYDTNKRISPEELNKLLDVGNLYVNNHPYMISPLHSVKVIHLDNRVIELPPEKQPQPQPIPMQIPVPAPIPLQNIEHGITIRAQFSTDTQNEEDSIPLLNKKQENGLTIANNSNHKMLLIVPISIVAVGLITLIAVLLDPF